MFIILYLSSIILGIIGAWVVARLGGRFFLLDISNHRSSHDGVVPKGGGIGILAVFVFASLFLEEPLAFWLPATVLALFSLLGDRIEISPKIRLPIQFIAAVVFLSYSYALSITYYLLPLMLFFTLFIVSTANWYNFMDGINGIAAITGIVGFSFLAAFNILTGGDGSFWVLSICIALSCLGFLPFNVPKAKVFMGDIGSILLGFVFASIVIMLSKRLLDFVCLAGFLFPFYADEFVTMAVRLKDGENLLKPHRRHFYQILANEMRIAHWMVSAGYGILQVLVGFAILSARHLGVYVVMSILIIFFIGFVWANYAVRMKVKERG